MLYILLTYDYELFFNETFYTEKEVLIDSASEIKCSLDQQNVKATFFVDTPCIYRYQKEGLTNFPAMVKKQVNELLNDGHDIQLHIHPSWFNAQYKGGEWSFKQTEYSLDAHENIDELIRISKRELDNLADNNINYNCCAFRAGGFCLSPEITILKELQNLGIVFDSSVCCGVKMESIAQSYDWSDIKYRWQWTFNPENGIRERVESGKRMIEIPVGTFSYIPQKWILTHGQPKLNYPPLKGKPSPVEAINKKSKIDKIINRIYASINTPILFSLDSLHYNALYKIVCNYLSKSKKENKDIYICAIAHPKFSSEESNSNTIQFIKKVKMNYNNEVSFITFKDAYQQMDQIMNQRDNQC